MLLNERRAARNERARITPRAPGADRIPLSFAQQRLWFLDQLEPGNPFYNLSTAVHLAGPLEPEVLARALGEVVRRHEVLRTRLVTSEGTAWQVVAPPEPFSLALVELDDTSLEREEAVRRFVREEARRPFDLARDVLLRARLLRLGPHEHVAVLSVHHIASDLWSMGVLVRELAALYQAFAGGRPSPLPDLPIQYADYALWQREWLQADVLEAQLDYWRKQLADAVPVFELQPDHRRPAVQTFAGARTRLRLPAGLVAGLREVSRREGATLFMTLLAAFDLLLFRLNGSSDVIVGTDLANRRRGETEELIGFFVNQVVLRTDLSGDPTFLELLRRVRTVTLDAYTHQDLPFDKLVEALNPRRDLGHTPLFQVKFIMQNAPMEAAVDLTELRFTRLELDLETSRFDVVVSLTEAGDEVLGLIEYNKDLYEQATFERLVERYTTLLAAIAADPARRLSELPLAPESEYQILDVWSRGAAAPPVSRGVQAAFEEQAARRPDAPAVAGAAEQLTYGELNGRANRLAHHLRTLGVRPGATVGICLERTPDLIAGLLAILKAGGAYLPLDAEYPRARLAAMMADAQPAVVITQESLEDQLPAHWAQVVCVDLDRDAIAACSAADPARPAPPEALAYVIYTSGSTGKPKGVMVPHAALASRVGALIDLYGIGPDDAVLQFVSVSFDAAAEEIFPALAAGARLELLANPAQTPPAVLLEECARRGVSVLHVPPAYLRQILEELRATGRPLPSWLRCLITGGEGLDVDSVTGWAHLNGHGARFFNAYGPAEATITCSAYEAPARAAELSRLPRLPIGRPLADTRIHVVDEALRPVPAGVPAELYVGGGALAWGYLGRPDLTAERFVPDPLSAQPGARLYRTGDRARFRADGQLDFLGRADEQVKIRAHRIELGDVETVLREHPAVRDAVAAVQPDGAGGQRLIGYWVPAAAVEPAEIERFVRQRLPDYMVPTAFMAIERLPVSPNGKVDRRALPVPDLSRATSAAFRAPRTPVEERLAAIWAQTLGVERVGLDDNFFALGGDSIRSIQVLARAKREGLSFVLQQLFQHQTLGQLAAVVQTGAQAPEPVRSAAFGLLGEGLRARLPQGLEDAYPLTMAQMGMVFHSEVAADVYHSIASLHVRGPLDVEALRAALRRLTQRHPILRTSFALAGFGEPLQFVHASVEPWLDVHDLSALTREAQERALDSWVEAEKARRFDWSACPLVRFSVHRRGADDFQFGLAAPHAVLDGWSDGLLYTELFNRYRRLLRNEPEPEAPLPGVLFRDYVAAEREALASEDCRRYWREKLDEAPQSTIPRWPAAEPLEGQTHVRLRRALSTDVATGLKALSQSAGVPLKSIMLAAHLRVLALLTGRADVVGGLVSNGREEGPDGDRVLGLFLNTLPLRLRLGDGTWLDLVRQVFEAERELLPYRRYPLAQIQADLGRGSLFETYFDYTHFHVYEGVESGGDLAVLGSRGNSVTNYTFGAFFNHSSASDDLSFYLTGDLTQLREEQLDRIAGYYVRALSAMAAQPGRRHGATQLLDEEERRQVSVEWSGASVRAEGAPAFLELFARRCASHPERVAASDGSAQITYAQLDRRSNQLARYLRAGGMRAESRVALLAERSLDQLVALLGVLKAGAACVPLDASYPRERVSRILAGSGAELVLVQEHLSKLLAQSTRRTYLDADWDIVAAESEAELERHWHAGQLAYVIYTSGSTGQPKGVMVEHRALAHFAQALHRVVYAPLGTGVWRVTLNAPLCFDASVQQWVQLGWGHRLEIVAEDRRRDPAAFQAWLAQREVDVLDCTPSQLRVLVETGFLGPEVKRPRCVLVGGEALDAELWGRLAASAGTRFFNVYGPTECTVDATADAVSGARPALGRPLPGVRAYVLDERLEPVPVGVTAELHLGGPTLARGYLGDAAATAAAWIPDALAAEPGARVYRTGDAARHLPDGRLEYAGRRDHQVKVRGYRIEPGEIEAAFRSHGGVRECAVLLREGAQAEPELVAYVVAQAAAAGPEGAVSGAPAPDVGELREHVRARLPEYMVPAAVVLLERMPLTANGKLDRRALPEPNRAAERGRCEHRGPSTDMERFVARIWSEVLGQEHEQLDVRDNFFDLGGHSLRAIQVVSRLREGLQIPVDLQLLFRAPTVAGLAELLEDARRVALETATTPAPPIVPVARDGDLPVSFAQQRLWFLDRLAPGGFAYNVPVSIRLEGPLDVAALERTFAELVRRHEVLRTAFAEVGGVPVQRVFPPPAVTLAPHDLSRLPEAAREEEARRLINAAVRTTFDLTRAPLFRLALLRLGPEDHVVSFTLHHIVSDGWSNGILMREVAALYAAFSAGAASPLPEPSLQYADFAVWQRQWLAGDVLEDELRYWRRVLGRDLSPLRLPLDRPRPAQPLFDGARRGFEVAGEVAQALSALGRQEGATLFMTLLAAFKALLCRDSGQDDVVVGTAAAGRSRRETEHMVGFFINMLALRTDLSGNPTFRQLLQRVRQVTLGAFAHQDVPFEKVVETLQPVRGEGQAAAPLFQVAFGLHNAPVADVEVRGLTLRPFGPDHEEARYDLTIWMNEGPRGLRGTWTYNKHLFDERTIVSMQRRYATLLRDAAARPDARLDDLRTLSDADARRQREHDRGRLLAARPVALRAAPGAPGEREEA
jgi:amino acid adenylation domain-containing protein